MVRESGPIKKRGIATDIRFSGLSASDPLRAMLLMGGLMSVVVSRLFDAMAGGAAVDPAVPMPFSPESFGQIGLALTYCHLWPDCFAAVRAPLFGTFR